MEDIILLVFIKYLKRNNIVFLILIALVGLLLYSYSLSGEFLHMDDVEGVLKNPQVLDIGIAFKELFLKSIINSVIYQTFQDNPLPYHLASVLLHIINAFLVFLISKKLFKKEVAMLASLLFTIHPANTEVVSWISGSVYLYRALFWLSTIYLFILFRKNKNKLYLAASILMYLLYFIFVGGVWGVVLPFVLLTLDYFVINKKYQKKKIFVIIPFIFIALGYFTIGFFRDYTIRTEDLEFYNVGLTAENRVVSILRAIDRSIRLFVFPYKLDILFGNFRRDALGYLGLIISFSVLVYVLYKLYKKSKVQFGLMASVYVAVLPIFSPVSIGLGYADRYFYFSTALFSLFAASFLLDWRSRIKKKELFVPILVFILLILSLRTFLRTLDWKNDETIWRASLAVNSENNYKAYNELGNVYYRNDQLREALMQYEKALEIRPVYPEVIHNVGLTYLKAGQLNNAKAFMQRSLELNPKMYQSYYRLGQIFRYEGNTELAKQYFMRTLEIKPDYIPAQIELHNLN